MFQKKERRDYKTFKSKFSSFISNLVLDMNSHEEDLEVFKRLLGWILALSSCQYRPFRITATFCGLYIQESLCRLIVHNYVDLESNQVSIATFSSLLDFIFNGLYLHRYRDVDPYIRAVCVKHLAEWIIIYPKKFLDNSYLRYIGWILSDKVAEARAEAITSIITLIESAEKDIIFSGIRSFLDRFLPRILECASRDKDNTAQNASLHLLHKLSAHELVDIEILDSLLFVLFSKNPQAKGLFVKILTILLSKKTQSPHMAEFKSIFSITGWLLQKFPPSFCCLKKDLCSLIVVSLVECYQGSAEAQHMHFENIVSFLCSDFSLIPMNEIEVDLDSIRQILLYFLSALCKNAGSSSNEIISLFILNWGKIFSNIHSTPNFKKIIFSIVHGMIAKAPISPVCESDSKEWLISISEIFSSAQMVFLDISSFGTEDTESTNVSLVKSIVSAFGIENLLVEKRTLLFSIYSHLEEQFCALSGAPLEHYLCQGDSAKLCITMDKLQCLYNELSTSGSLLFDDVKKLIVGHFEKILDQYNGIFSVLQAYPSNSNVLTLFNYISTYLFSISKLIASNEEASQVIFSIIKSSSTCGVVTKSSPSTQAFALYTDALLFALKSGKLSVKDIDRTPLDCIENSIVKNFYTLSRSNSSKISTDFSEFVAHIGCDLEVVRSDEYSNIKCYLKLLFMQLVDAKILKLFLQLFESLPNPLILLFKSYLAALSEPSFLSSIINTLAEGFLDLSNSDLSSVEHVQRLDEFLCSIFSPSHEKGTTFPQSHVLETFTIALVSAFVKQYFENKDINFYIFKLVNEGWAKNLSANAAYEINASVESICPEKSTPFLEHFIQFKKYINRTSLPFKGTVKKNIPNSIESTNVSICNPKSNSMDLDLQLASPSGMASKSGDSEITEQMVEEEEQSAADETNSKILEFPTSPELY